VATVIYRELAVALYHVFVGAAKTTAVVMFWWPAASVSAWLIKIANLPQGADLAAAAVHPPADLADVIIMVLTMVGVRRWT